MKAKWISIFLVFAMMFSVLSACNNVENEEDVMNDKVQDGLTEDSGTEAEAVKLIADGSVEMMCINKGWKVKADPNDEGIAQQWYNEVSGTDIEIPGNAADVIDDTGISWFTVEFESNLNVSSDQRVYISLEGAGFVTKVWLNGIPVGEHLGSYGIFDLDVTDAIKHGEKNILAVYSSNRYSGYDVGQLPILLYKTKLAQPVYVYVKPEVTIVDTYVHPSTADGTVEVKVTVNNSGDKETNAVLSSYINEKTNSYVIDRDSLEMVLPVGESTHELILKVENFKYWSPDDPFLYDVYIDVLANDRTDKVRVRTGYKDLRVGEDGYFYLNGERFYLKTTHTTVHMVDSIENVHNLDGYYNLLVFLKTSGFNSIRILMGSAYPQIYDMCAEIGLLVYEEHSMDWNKRDSDRTEEFFHLSVSEVIERNKNAVSLGMFGLLNETTGASEDGTAQIFKAALNELSYIRETAPHLLVMLGSGRWDGIQNLGSASNPYSQTFDGFMGNEAADNLSVTEGGHVDGYMESMGDVHYYPELPMGSDAREMFEKITSTEKAVFISESGYGSLANVYREALYIEHNEIRDNMSYDLIKRVAQDFRTYYSDYHLDTIYGTPEKVLIASQAHQSKYRAYELTMIRRNGNVTGLGLTMAFDSDANNEGLIEQSGYAKSGVVDMLQESLSDLRFCITLENPHIWSGEDLDLEVVISDWGALKDKDYPVLVRITSDYGTLWEKEVTIRPGDKDVIPVIDEIIPTDGWGTGTYYVGAEILSGAHADCGVEEFYVTNEKDIQRIDKVVYGYKLKDDVVSILEKYGATVIEYNWDKDIGDNVLIVGGSVKRSDQQYLYNMIENGANVVMLKSQIFASNDEIRFPYMGSKEEANSSLYLYNQVGLKTDVMSGLQTGCILEEKYYGDLIDYMHIFGTAAPLAVPTVTHIATFTVGTQDDKFIGGYMLGTYAIGKGSITMTSLNFDKGAETPAGTAILCNLANYKLNK